MKNLSFILGFLALTAQSLTAGNVTTYPNVSSVAGSDIFFDWQSGAQQNATGTQLKAFITGGGTLSIGTGKTLTSSNTLTFAGMDGSSVNFGTGGTVLYSLGIGSSTQAYSAKLDALAALASPGTTGYVLSATTGGALSWVSNSTPFATTSGTNTYTATPSPALTAYTTGLIVAIKFANANTGGASLNLNGLGAVTVQQNSAAVAAGQIQAGTTVSLFYDGTNFQILGNSAVAYVLPQATTSVLGGVKPDGTTITATAGVITAGSVHVISTGTLTAGTATVTVPSGVSPWVQSTNTGTLTNNGALSVSVSGTTATVDSSNALDTSTFNLFYYQ